MVLGLQTISFIDLSFTPTFNLSWILNKNVALKLAARELDERNSWGKEKTKWQRH